jgi:long-chain acyl-CoA synthetase
VVELIGEEVRKVNASLAQVEQVKRFRLLPKALDHDDQELTATMKVRRRTIAERFAPLIESMYGEAQPASRVS